MRVHGGKNMNRRTAQNQRKVRFPNVLRRKTKKEKVEGPVAETKTVESADASCQTRGCGCGN